MIHLHNMHSYTFTQDINFSYANCWIHTKRWIPLLQLHLFYISLYIMEVFSNHTSAAGLKPDSHRIRLTAKCHILLRVKWQKAETILFVVWHLTRESLQVSVLPWEMPREIWCVLFMTLCSWIELISCSHAHWHTHAIRFWQSHQTKRIT